jgi:hypothetical protein
MVNLLPASLSRLHSNTSTALNSTSTAFASYRGCIFPNYDSTIMILTAPTAQPLLPVICLLNLHAGVHIVTSQLSPMYACDHVPMWLMWLLSRLLCSSIRYKFLAVCTLKLFGAGGTEPTTTIQESPKKPPFSRDAVQLYHYMLIQTVQHVARQ